MEPGQTFPVVTGDIDEAWNAHIAAQRTAELDRIIAEQGLRPDKTREFVDRAFRDGGLQAAGTAITHILPPASRFAVDGGHGEKKQRVLIKLGEFFERFFGLTARASGAD